LLHDTSHRYISLLSLLISLFYSMNIIKPFVQVQSNRSLIWKLTLISKYIIHLRVQYLSSEFMEGRKMGKAKKPFDYFQLKQRWQRSNDLLVQNVLWVVVEKRLSVRVLFQGLFVAYKRALSVFLATAVLI